MRAKVRRLRARGVVLPRQGAARDADAQGELRVEEHGDGLLGRSLRTARLLSTSDGIHRDLLPPLYDVNLVAMAQNGFTLTGFERIANGKESADYAQSWWCQGM